MELIVAGVELAVVDKKPEDLELLYHDLVAGLRTADERVQNRSLDFLVVEF